MTWFNTGKSAEEAAHKSGGGGGDYSSFRFFLKPNNAAVIAFCDGDNTEAEPIGHYREHSFNRNNSRAPGFATCAKGTGMACALCDAGLKPYDAWPFTIIQIKPIWTDKEGKEHGNQKKLMVVKKEMMQRVLRFIEQREGLAGTVWDVHRSGKRSYTVGDDWQFKHKIEGGRSGLPKHLTDATEFPVKDEDVSPLNYMELLKPKTLEELQAMGADIEATLKREAEWAARDQDSDDRRDSGGGGSSGSSDSGERRSAGVTY